MVAIRSVDVTELEPRIVLHAGHDPLVIPGGNALLTAEFHQHGPDLLIHGQHSTDVLVHDYFATNHAPALLTESGLRLDGDLVTALARPEGYVQFAQDQTAQADTNGGAQPIGKVDSIAGSVEVHHADGSTAQLAQGAPVFQGDVIQTGGDGQIGITFVDGTAFSLQPGARMTLDDLVYSADGKNNSFSASVLQGTFVFMAGKIAPSGHMEVKTPVGTIGIRGTTVGGHLSMDGNDNTFVLFRDAKTGHLGKVEFTNAGGTQVLDVVNASTHVTSFFAAPSAPIPLPPQDAQQYFNDMLLHFYQLHGGAPADNEPGQQGSIQGHGDHLTADQLAPANLGDFPTAAGPAAAGHVESSGFAPLSPLLGFVPPISAPVVFTSVGLAGEVVLGQNNGFGFGSEAGVSSHIPLDNVSQPNQVQAQPASGLTPIHGTPGPDDLGSPSLPGPVEIFGSGGDDVLTGSNFDDVIHGGDGNDVLDGGAGNDQAFGDGGNDVFDGGTGLGNDYYDGGVGVDTVEYSSATLNITVNLTTGTASGDPDIGTDTLVNIENVIGGSGNDTIIGNGADNVLYGGAGNDTLEGLGGNDTLIGGIPGTGDQAPTSSGVDVAVFRGLLAQYGISETEGGAYLVTDSQAGRDGTDTLIDITRVRFADGEFNLTDLVNHPPSTPADLDDGKNAVDENATNGTAVGITINATQITDATITYSLTGDTSNGGFQVDPNTGIVTVADGSKIDYESAPDHQYQITVQASDGHLTSQSSFTIGVGDVAPSAPADAGTTANAVQENAEAGTTVGITASANDPAGGNVTYSLADDPTKGGFQIDATTGVVTVADGSKIDFESAPEHQYQITVQSSDGSLTSQSSFTIDVGDVSPSAPADTDTTANVVAENAETGTAVGITATATDPAGGTVTYSLTGDSSNGGFQVDATTGIVTVADGSKIDYEAVSTHDYQITIQASDGALASQASFTIGVTNVNETPGAPTDTNSSANTVAEDTATGTTVGITAAAIDPDGDTVTYSLVGDTSNGGFQIDASTGIVTVADGSKIIDVASSSNQYQITVQASDGSLTSQSNFNINVTPVNHAPGAPVDVNGSNNTVAENAATGTAVGITAASTDPDGDTVTYSLVGDTSNGGFQINAQTGVVTVADGSKINFEAVSTHDDHITVQASDGSLTSQSTFSIGVTNINEGPAAPIDANSSANTVAENAAAGTVVGITATATDPAGGTVTYSLTGDSSNGGFQVDATTGIVTVADGSKIDYEAVSTHDYQITIQASDGSLTSQSNLTIGVTNVNEAPAAPTDANSSVNTVAENAATGTAVGIMAASTDPDGDTVTYSLVGDTSNGGFQVNAQTGVVTVADGSKIDYEAVSTHDYHITVQASDGSLTSQSTFAVGVTNVNEAPAAPIDANSSANTVAEKAATGTAVGITAASADPDGDTVTYSLVGDTSNGGFQVNGQTGVVTVADGSKIDYEAVSTHNYQVTVEASDGSLTSQSTFAVGVTNVNEAPAAPIDVNSSANTVTENAAAGTVVGITAASTDPDGDTVTYSLVGDTSNGGFQVNAQTGVVTVAVGSKIDYEAVSTHDYHITVQASDGALTSQSTFAVGVTNVNETPSAPADADASDNTVLGHADAGTAVGITATASDPDGDTVTYSLLGDTSNGGFQINAQTGIVTVADGSNIDYNAASSEGYQIIVQASDGSLTSQSDFTIQVQPPAIQPPPSLDLDGDNSSGDSTTGYLATFSGSAIAVTDRDVAITTSNGALIAGASISLAGVTSQDSEALVLNGTLPSGISVSDFTYSGGVGHLTLSGVASAADYATILQKIAYENTGDEISEGVRYVNITLTDTNGHVSNDAIAQINIGTGSQVFSGDVTAGDPLIVGDTGQGELDVLAGGHALAEAIIVGNAATGDGILTLDPGSSAGFGSDTRITVGNAGMGKLSVLGSSGVASTVDANIVLIGEQESGSGTATVSGIGAAIVTSGNNNAVFVGDSGHGTLTVEAGGQIRTLDVEIGVGGTGTALITGPGSTVIVSNDTGNFGDPSPDEAGFVRVGTLDGGSGTLNVTNGGSLEIRAGLTVNTDTTDPLLVIASDLGSAGTVTVDGSGSSIALSMTAAADPNDQIATLNGPGLEVGEMGKGQMTVSNMATVSMTGDEAYLDVGVGDWQDPDDATSLPQSVLQISTGGTITVTDTAGGQGGLLVGDYLDGNGKIIVDGKGSTIDINSQGGGAIGRAGTGELTVQNGAKVTITSDNFNNLDIGRESTASGTVTVMGPGSAIVTKGTDNTVQVGRQGTGNLTVSDGGQISTLQFEVGRDGSGSAMITGAGSTVTASNDGGLYSAPYVDEAGYARVGYMADSSGSLTVSDGGLLEIRAGASVNTGTTDPELDIAWSYDSAGTVTVDGNGSQITVTGNAAVIAVGMEGTGAMNLSNNAAVTVIGANAQVVVGAGNWSDDSDHQTTGGGTLSVGIGAILTVTGTAGAAADFDIGGAQNGNGSVTVIGGGRIEVTDGAIETGNYGTGSLSISGTSLLPATVSANSVDVGIQVSGVGTLTIDGAGASLVTIGTDNIVTIGDMGDGTLTAKNGGLLDTLDFEVGRAESGVVTITGDGSTVRVSNDGGLFSDPYTGEAGYVRIGNLAGSDGTLSIADGGLLEIRAGATVNTDTTAPDLYIAQHYNSNGTVTVNGTGSCITVTGPEALLTVGIMGEGSLALSNAATVDVTGADASVMVGVGNWNDANDHAVTGGGTLSVATGAKLTVTGAGVGVADLNIGAEQNGNGTVNVNAGGQIEITDGSVEIGNSGIGNLNIIGTLPDAAGVDANWVQVGNHVGATGTLTISGPGASLTTSGIDNGINVGNAGTGTLTVENGGQLDVLTFQVGHDGTGTATVTGSGSAIVVSNDTGVDSDPDSGEAGFAVIGRDSGSSGTLNVLAGGSLEVRAGFNVNADTTDPLLLVGRYVGSTGTVLVDGPGSTIALSMTAQADPLDQINSLNGPGLEVGDMGNGQMTVSHQASVTMTGDEAYLDVGVGDWQDPGDTTDLPQSVLQVLSGGSITVTDTADGKGGLLIGDFLNGNGKIVVDGAGSAINIISQGGGAIGRDGAGELAVQNGATVTITSDNFNNLDIGRDGTGNGTVTVTGSGSAIVTKGTDNTVQVGREGTGSLTVSDGGLVRTLQFEVGSDGTGTATIMGAGSTVTASNDGGLFSDPYVDEAGYVRVGNMAGSNGTLTISGGGLLDIRAGTTVNTDTTDPELDIAQEYNSTGTVTVDGAGSQLNVTGPEALLTVGIKGDGALTLNNGAAVTVTGADASVMVGVGDWNDDNDHAVTGGGTLTVGAAAELTVTGDADSLADLNIGSVQNGNGIINVNAGGQIVVTDGSVEVGDRGVGALAIVAGSLLTIQSRAGTRGQSGLTVARNENSTGTVQIAGSGSQLNISSPNLGSLMEGPFLVLAAGQSLFQVDDHAAVTIQGSGAYAIFGSETTSVSEIDVTHGGEITVDGQTGDATVMVASVAGATATVKIDGADSQLSVDSGTGQMLIGANFDTNHNVVTDDSGNGAVTVSNGGTLDVGSAASHGTGGAEIVVGAHGSLDIAGGTVMGDVSDQGGQISIGHDVISTATLIGDLDMSSPASTLEIDAGGTAAGQADKLNVTGDVALTAATVDVHLQNGYAPQAGDTFSFLSASGTISGSPSDISLVVHNVDPSFRFELLESEHDVQFHALTNAGTGTADVFLGGDKDDTFTAIGSNNALFGGAGDDTLTGSNTGNVIEGGAGADHMTGGNGADTFSFVLPSDGVQVSSNVTVASNSTSFDQINNFDAQADKISFAAGYTQSAISTVDNTNFSKISTPYDGTNGTSAQYAAGHPSFILDGNSNLIYDSNGSGAGYTIVAHINVAPGSPAVTPQNLHVS